MEHKKPPFLVPGGASLPRGSRPHGPGAGSRGPDRRAASGGASRWRARGGRAHPRPGEAAEPGRRQQQTLAPGRHERPPPPRRAAATSVQGMREPPSPGHPEEKAVPPGNPGHVGLPGAASALVPGAGSGQCGARLPAWTQGVCRRGSPGPHVRVLCATCIPALPHHLRRVPSLQHLPDPLQDRLPPPPRASPFPASLCLLPRLEEDRWGAGGLWGSNMPATVPERRELRPAWPLSLPCRVAGRCLPDRCGRVQRRRGRLSPALCQHGGQLLVPVLGGAPAICGRGSLPA
ncbi:epidermal growth factor-like protein 7 isoform X2 [Ovis aries]|uniref:epidermal growth factor-like protein 7 isoform X2 n=1 Tax=Ovis aries TaxID=9940 RepID=UPI0029527A76|nr:epidermal growth factor-like protein 7 isoform X2 [Ovis aries]